MDINPKRKPLGYGKKLYIGEFLAERLIQVIALLSIAAILAIFYYVFHESIYAFKEGVPAEMITSTGNSHENTAGSQAENDGPETYSPDEGAVESSNSTPETYPPAEADEAPAELKPETYAPTGSDAATAGSGNNSGTAAETAVPAANYQSRGEAPVTPSQLIFPNDTIDGKPAYIWQPISETPKFSFIPLFVGALKVTLIAVVLAAPIAILAAIFTVAFAPKWLKEIIKPAIEILAGFPSIVIGFFCLMTLATLIQETFGTTYRLNSFVGGVGMALAVIPIIYTVAEDALSAIPKYLSEASLALGASRWDTAYRVLLPAATPGVFAAIILGFGRAFGETMIALMATGNAALVSTDIFESVRTMAATIGAEMAEVEFRSAHYGILFLIGAVLFVITFSLNAIAEFYVRKRLLKKFQGQ
ncbi:MAG: phosphate ABC transporter permease subunit PstC [Chloroflexota bacterium]